MYGFWLRVKDRSVNLSIFVAANKRKPAQSRSSLRKRAILDATVRVIARSGTNAVTHRAVAKEADVPLAATTYYFASKDDLLAESFCMLADAEIAEIERGLDELPDTMSPDVAAALAASFVASDLRQKHAQILAEMELHLEAGRRQELDDTHRRWSDATLRFCEIYMQRAGSRQPEIDGGLFLSVITGLQLGEVAKPTPAFEQMVAFPLFQRLFRALCKRA